jgi:para-nitrobenzyl esterase
MSEDCLALNVVAPESPDGDPPDGPLPVMVFIHGGAYFAGSSATPLYNGAFMARRGCVFVSVNYRLGALGCVDFSALSTPTTKIEGNLFLRDLVMALRWVRDNVAVFGGDPDNVTIFGESAGAHAVATLLAVPAAKGLFARAISESPASGLLRPSDAAAAFAARFVESLGARRDDAADVLMAARPAELVDTLIQFVDSSPEDMPGALPVGPTFGTDYLPLDPIAAMRAGKAHRIPLIVGTNADEGRLFARFLKLLPLTEPLIERLLAHTGSADRMRITAAYPGYPNPAACVQLGADCAFGAAAWQIAEAHGWHAPAYLYRFDYASVPV